MKYASLKYHHKSMNLGDVIQSLAAEQYLPRVDVWLERDALNDIPGDTGYLTIMNGWFTSHPSNWPPALSLLPVFFGFHIANKEKIYEVMFSQASLDYFKNHEPIGCRDRKTAELLSARGIHTFYSQCLTLTFPKRRNPPKDGLIFIVDAAGIPLPAEMEKRARYITHDIPCDTPDEGMRDKARGLLDMYRDRAELVITTKLHCALPCIAMGIPVIFFGDPFEYRISIVKDIGIDILPMPAKRLRRLYRISKKLQDSTSDFPIVSTIFSWLHNLLRQRLMRGSIPLIAETVEMEGAKKEISQRLHDLMQAAITRSGHANQRTA